MRNVPALTRRELNTMFFSPLAYLVLTVFLFFSGFFFYLIAAETQQATLLGYVSVISFLFLVATPFLTMRLLSEEYRSGTIEGLMTAPVTDAEVVLAKYIGVLVFFVVMLVPTLAYVVVLSVLGDPEPGPIVSAYVGLALMGAQFLALGLFCSSLTRSQIVAGITALVMLLVIWVLGAVGEEMVGPFAPIFRYVGTAQHLDSFTNGRIAFRDVFYFVSLTLFWLFLAVRALESRRWR